MWLVFIDIDGFWCIHARAENTRLNLFNYARNHVVRMGGAVQIGHGAEALAARFIKCFWFSQCKERAREGPVLRKDI